MLRWCNVVMLRYVVDVEVVIDVVMLRCCYVEIC